jgi:hypothetical protein
MSYEQIPGNTNDVSNPVEAMDISETVQSEEVNESASFWERYCSPRNSAIKYGAIAAGAFIVTGIIIRSVFRSRN